jgi:hypothetical protein
MALAMASNAAWLMEIRIMSRIWGQAALVASHRKSSGFVCGPEAGAFAARGFCLRALTQRNTKRFVPSCYPHR